MLIRLRDVLPIPANFFSEGVLPDRAFGDLTDGAGGRFTIVHMKIEFHFSIRVFGD